MKRTPLLLALALCGFLAACASDETKKDESTPAVAEQPLPTKAESIYDTAPIASPVTATPAAPSGPETIVDYTVKSGDSLWLIARNHGTSVARVRELNGGLAGDVIRPGQVLKVPQK
jgi:LysM repeat protein